jgi:hypothetical protein
VIADALRSAPRDPRLRAADRTAETDAVIREFEATKARWFVLITDERSKTRTETRERVLAGVAAALDLEPHAGSPGGTACLWAFAGWCWRESERGDRAPLADELAQAHRQAAQLGLVGDALTAHAARIVASGASELGSGSPGHNESERKGFLARAFREVGPGGNIAPLDDHRRWFAFRYGVAVHDLEELLPRRGTATAA